MKILVTGSEGLLGRATVAAAERHGATVLRRDRVVPEFSSWSYQQIDVCDLGQVVESMEGTDAVIHLAAFRDDRMVTPSATFRANVTGTHNVLTAARILGIPKVVLASSVRVVVPYDVEGWPGYRSLPVDEDHPVFPRGEYARSKVVGEEIAESMAAEFGMDVVSLRYARLVEARQGRDAVFLQHDLPNAVHYVDIGDAATCTWLAAASTIEPGRHLCCFVTAADSALDVPSSEYARERFPEAEWRGDAGAPFVSLISGRRATEHLGFEPAVSWRDHHNVASAEPSPRRWQRRSRRSNATD